MPGTVFMHTFRETGLFQGNLDGGFCGNPDLMEDEDINIHTVLMGDILEIELVGLFTK